MALIDDYRQVYENDTEYRQRLTVQLGQTVTSILAGTPTVEQENFGRLFAQSPSTAVAQVQPFAASFTLNRADADLTDDTQMLTAVEQSIAMLVSLDVGIPAPA